MELRHRMIEFVRDGRIERAEYDSLFEVLCEAWNYLPQHRDDVDRALQLLAKLVPVAPAQPQPPRQLVYLVGPATEVGEMIVRHQAMQERSHDGPSAIDLVSLGRIEHLGILAHKSNSGLLALEHLFPDDPAAPVLPFTLRELDRTVGEQHKEFKKPRFNGYMGKQHGRKKGR